MEFIEKVKNSDQHKLLHSISNGSHICQVIYEQKDYEENKDRYAHLTKKEVTKFFGELHKTYNEDKNQTYKINKIREIRDKYGVPHNVIGYIIVPEGEE